MAEWELDCNPMVRHIAQAQAKKLVEWLTTEDAYGLHQRMLSRDVWQELRRQVGLE